MKKRNSNVCIDILPLLEDECHTPSSDVNRIFSTDFAMERIHRYKKLSKEMKGSLITFHQMGLSGREISARLNVNVCNILINTLLLRYYF